MLTEGTSWFVQLYLDRVGFLRLEGCGYAPKGSVRLLWGKPSYVWISASVLDEILLELDDTTRPRQYFDCGAGTMYLEADSDPAFAQFVLDDLDEYNEACTFRIRKDVAREFFKRGKERLLND